MGLPEARRKARNLRPTRAGRENPMFRAADLGDAGTMVRFSQVLRLAHTRGPTVAGQCRIPTGFP